MLTAVWRPAVAKRARRVSIAVLVLGPAVYFLPKLTLFFVVCGLVDVGRHRRKTYDLFEKYFLGNGLLTWMLSPVNLLTDLLSYRNPRIYALADLPPEHRREIETCVREFVDHGDRIKRHVADELAQHKRCMLTFRWFGTAQETGGLRIPAFEHDYRHIKTIAVSVFSTRERTSWHFGPLRLTLRVLYVLDPMTTSEAFIEVDDRLHRWKDDRLFIFDDTNFHRSTNGSDQPRYCLFMDIVRPNHARVAFDAGIHLMRVLSGSLKRLFYKNWAFVR